MVELLITLTIFSIVAIISMTVLINGLRSAKKIQAQVFLYSEAQAIMDMIAREIEQSTVDYEAYYARNVQGESGWDTENYGDYAKSFFSPGTGGWDESPYVGMAAWYGVTCPSDPTMAYPEDCPDEVPAYDDLDVEVGTHPFTNIDDFTGFSSDDPETMNAFCEGSSRYGDADCADFGHAFTNELILINANGDHRVIYYLDYAKDSSTEYALYRLALDGTDSDGNGVVDTWLCASSYECAGDVPRDRDFIEISPEALNISHFDVLIAPYEDPYRAFGEADVQVQPQVTLSLRFTLSTDYSWGLLGSTPAITLQRTVSTGVYGKVISHE